MRIPFDSKTVIGLVVILVAAIVMALFGKLTEEFVEVLKYVGTSYMAVRGIANYSEQKYGK